MDVQATDTRSGENFPDERRTGERTTTVFRPVTITGPGFQSFCIVRNLSANGMMGKVYADIPVGTSLSVQFNSNLSIKGHVAWSNYSDSHWIGVEFDEAIEVSGVLTEVGKMILGQKVNRGPRLQLKCRGAMEIGGRGDSVDNIEVHDVSQRGLKVRTSCVLSPGDEVFIRLSGLEKRKAIVRWTEFDLAGLNFVRPLGIDELARWAIRQQFGPVGTVQAGRDHAAETM
ncbi:PilZ domain-containing protein [Novosphingobium sp. ZN18A2]|uniref:PilZ domain-containing protein n=1 Tax=Novosphingobium sp. ZN18A2 TaxID=3079861 RepID=UPI0030D285E3